MEAKRTKLREEDMAAPVMEWLHSRGFTPYGEVPWNYRGIDVVGLSETSAESVEMKLSLTKQVIYQANITLSAVDRAWCAVATAPRSLDSRIANGWLKNLGVVRVVGGRVDVLREAPPAPHRGYSWQDSLREACSMLTPWGKAGMPTMLGVGPAQAVFNKVCEYREKNPTATWKELFREVPNHYSHYRSMQGAMRVVEDVRAARAKRLAAKNMKARPPVRGGARLPGGDESTRGSSRSDR